MSRPRGKRLELPVVPEEELHLYKEIPGYGGKYAVSESGEVISYAYDGIPHRMKNFPNKGGYIVISLTPINGVRRADQFSVAFLVLSAWGPKRPSLDHKTKFLDGNKNNIHISNLQWQSRFDLTREVSNRLNLPGNNTIRKPKRVFYSIDVNGVATRHVGVNDFKAEYGYDPMPYLNRGKVRRDKTRLVPEREYLESYINNYCK